MRTKAISSSPETTVAVSPGFPVTVQSCVEQYFASTSRTHSNLKDAQCGENTPSLDSMRQDDGSLASIDIDVSTSGNECQNDSNSQHDIVDDEPQRLKPENIAADNTAYATRIPLGKTTYRRRTVYGYPRSFCEFPPAYNAATVEIVSLLEMNLAKDERTKSIIRRQLKWNSWMCGSSQQSAAPALVLLCEQKHFMNIVKVLTSSHIVEELNVVAPLCRQRITECTNDRLRFDLYFVAADKPIMICGATFVQLGTADTNEVQAQHSKILHGLKVYAPESQNMATLTCLLQVGTEYYGLTTAHSFQTNEETSEWSTCGPISDSVCHRQNSTNTSTTILGTETERVFHGLATGELLVLEKQDINFAVVEDLDWAIISFNQHSLHDMFSKHEWSQPRRSICPSIPLEERPVLIHSSTTKEPLHGTLLRGKTYISLHAYRKRVEAWTIQLLDNNELTKGDSGSIVVDAARDVIYGYVVSLDAFGFAQIISLDAVVQQIKVKFKADEVDLVDCQRIVDDMSKSIETWETFSEISQQDYEDDVFSKIDLDLADTESQQSHATVAKNSTEASSSGLGLGLRTNHLPHSPRILGPTAMEWELIRPLFKQLYLSDRLPLSEISTILCQTYGVNATKRQYKSKLHKWGLRRHLRSADRSFIIAKSAERTGILGRSTKFFLQGIEIPEARLKRMTQESHDTSSSPKKRPQTPPHITYSTPQSSPEPSIKLETTPAPHSGEHILPQLDSVARQASKAVRHGRVYSDDLPPASSSERLRRFSGGISMDTELFHNQILGDGADSMMDLKVSDTEDGRPERRLKDDDSDEAIPPEKKTNSQSIMESLVSQ